MTLDPNQKRAIRHLWKGELTLEEIAEEMHLSMEQLRAEAEALELPERDETEVYLPNREEILMAAAEIRSKWTPAEREARLAAGRLGRIEDATGVDTNVSRTPARSRTEGGQADGSSRRRGRRGRGLDVRPEG